MKITKKKIELIHDLIEGKLRKYAIAKKHGITERTLERWEKDPDFITVMDRLVQKAIREQERILAAKVKAASVKLFDLAMQGTLAQELQRKACNDILGKFLR